LNSTHLLELSLSLSLALLCREAIMDIIHKIMNIIIPPIALTMLVTFLPTYLFFQLLLSIKRSIFKEDVAGKVILITGASSGIGEVCSKPHFSFACFSCFPVHVLVYVLWL
jgi:hypothetical protein